MKKPLLVVETDRMSAEHGSTSIACNSSVITWTEPTMHLKFVDGILHQAFLRHNGVDFPEVFWQPVPSEKKEDE